ncbi:MAG: PLP-dependent aminotransferase family protein, partial [Clostridia bacterium]
MQYKFSKKISSLKPSAIREILKATSNPNIIPFAAGNPAPEAFPITQINEIISDILKNEPINALQYSITEGYPQLITKIKSMLKSDYNIGTGDDELLIVSGAQQGIELACKCLCDEGDAIICETPSFIGSLNSFRSFNAKLIGVPVEEDGMNIQLLKNALENNKNVKMIYIISNFQNPSGITTSLEKRKEIYSLAKKHDVVVIEDNPYGDLNFTKEFIPAIKTFDNNGNVLY